MAIRNPSEHGEWVAPLLLALLMAAAIATFLDKWLWSNELFNSLSMGLSYGSQEESLMRLREEALRYCDVHAPPADLASCKVYQNVITDRARFAHPLSALLGLQTRNLLGDPHWLPGLHLISAELPLVSGFLALGLWLALTLALPRQDRATAVAVTLCLLAIGQSHDRGGSPLADTLREAGRWTAPVALAIAAAAPAILSKAMPVRLASWAARASHPSSHGLVLWASAGLFLLSLILPPVANAALAPLAVAIFLAFWLPLAARDSALSPALLASIVGLLFVAVTAEPHWFMRRLGYAGSLAALIYVAAIALSVTRPRSRLVWLMAIMTLFHLPISALLGLTTAMAETILLLRTRAPSHLLGASVLTGAIGIGGAILGIDGATFAPGSARVDVAIPMILSWQGLAPAAATIAVTLSLAAVPLRALADETLPLARAGLLIAAGLAASLIAAALQQQDPALLNAPGFALFAKSGNYATPGLFAAGILSSLLALNRLLDSAAAPSHAPSSRNALVLATSLLLLMGVAKLDLKLRNGFAPGPLYLWRYVIAGDLHPQWCRFLSHASLEDDAYYLSKMDPTNDAIIYWSALKARLRVDAGTMDAQALTIGPAIDDPHGCR